MVRANKGDVKIFGMDHRKHIREIKNKVGYVGEEQYFYGDKTVAWNADFFAGFYDNWDTNLCQSLITEFAISRTKKTRELSKGMKVKLSLALALSHQPELFMLDEPTAGLDPIVRHEVLELLRQESKVKNRSVIISSHITDDIARIADLIVFLIDGKIALTEEKDELLSKWKRIHYQDGALSPDLISTLKTQQQHMFGHSGVTDNYPLLKVKLSSGLAQETIKVENVNLDDILIAHVKGDQ